MALLELGAKKIIFNDPSITGTVVKNGDGVHDNHLHVEFPDGITGDRLPSRYPT